jgi:hypothetical protein
MCRSTIDGGRRCPSHTDPVLIANRNARRREKYAKAHNKAVKPKGFDPYNLPEHLKNPQPVKEEPAVGKFIPQQSEPIDEGLAAKHGLFRAHFTETGNLYSNTGNVFSYAEEEQHSALGVTSKHYEGELTDTEYLSSRQVSGQINYTKLNEESYKAFGFQDPEEERKTDLNLDQLKQLSKEELTDYPLSLQHALRYFTSGSFEWVNSALFKDRSGTPMTDRNPDKAPYQPVFKNEPFSETKRFGPAWQMDQDERETPELLKETVTKIDLAMSNSHKQQRVLYRGMAADHSAFLDSGVESYVDKNMSLGQEVIFDGYQSSSYSPTVAADYSGNNGLVFEIRTPSGINLTGISAFPSEREVLLPRNTRYMVVGVHKKVEWTGSSPSMWNGESRVKEERSNTTVVQLVEITEEGYVRDENNFKYAPPLTEGQLKSNPYDDTFI